MYSCNSTQVWLFRVAQLFSLCRSDSQAGILLVICIVLAAVVVSWHKEPAMSMGSTLPVLEIVGFRGICVPFLFPLVQYSGYFDV